MKRILSPYNSDFEKLKIPQFDLVDSPMSFDKLSHDCISEVMSHLPFTDLRNAHSVCQLWKTNIERDARQINTLEEFKQTCLKGDYASILALTESQLTMWKILVCNLQHKVTIWI